VPKLERLDKILAHSGFGSRKDVNKLIKNKQVKINGQIVKKGDMKVDPFNDIILVDDKVISYVEHVYIMMNKPKGYVSATIDNIYPTVVDLVEEYKHKNLFVVGRLDVDTTGLLLLTNDGAFAHNITSPKKDAFKVYQALIDGKLTQQQLLQLEKGVIILDDYLTKPAKVKILEINQDTSLVELSISEGKFHQVKEMFRSVGHNVLGLKRVKIKGLSLDSSLKEGHYRLLTLEELELLS